MARSCFSGLRVHYIHLPVSESIHLLTRTDIRFPILVMGIATRYIAVQVAKKQGYDFLSFMHVALFLTSLETFLSWFLRILHSKAVSIPPNQISHKFNFWLLFQNLRSAITGAILPPGACTLIKRETPSQASLQVSSLLCYTPDSTDIAGSWPVETSSVGSKYKHVLVGLKSFYLDACRSPTFYIYSNPSLLIFFMSNFLLVFSKWPS